MRPPSDRSQKPQPPRFAESPPLSAKFSNNNSFTAILRATFRVGRLGRGAPRMAHEPLRMVGAAQ
jgi:hypothetical protein